MQYLLGEVNKFPHKFLKFCKNGDTFIKNEIRDGFVSVFVLECRKCKVQHAVCSEQQDSDYLSVNLAFVAGILSLGLNLFTLNEICSSLHIPAVNADEFNQYVDEIYDIYNESITDSESSSFIKSPIRTSTPMLNGVNKYRSKKAEFLKELQKTPEEILQLSKLTKNQNGDPLWFEERKKRLTASNFGRISKLLDTTNRKNVVQYVL